MSDVKPGLRGGSPQAEMIAGVFDRIDAAITDLLREMPGLDFHTALKEVLTSDPDLAEEYRRAMLTYGTFGTYHDRVMLTEELRPIFATFKTRQLRTALWQ